MKSSEGSLLPQKRASLSHLFCNCSAQWPQEPLQRKMGNPSYVGVPGPADRCYKHKWTPPLYLAGINSHCSPSEQCPAPTPGPPAWGLASVCASWPMLSRIQVRHARPSEWKSRPCWTVPDRMSRNNLMVLKSTYQLPHAYKVYKVDFLLAYSWIYK